MPTLAALKSYSRATLTLWRGWYTMTFKVC